MLASSGSHQDGRKKTPKVSAPKPKVLKKYNPDYDKVADINAELKAVCLK